MDESMDEGCNSCLPFYAAVEWLNMQVRRQEGYNVATQLQVGNDTFDLPAQTFDRANGLRAALGFRLDDENELRFTYTWVNTDHDSAQNFGVSTGGFNFNVYDIDYVRPITLGGMNCRPFVGWRYLTLATSLNYNFSFPGGNNVVIDIPSGFHAYGLRFGTEVEKPLARGFGVYTKFTFSTLIGDFHSAGDLSVDLPIINLTTNTPLSLRKDFDQVIPMTEVAIGVSYTYGACEFRTGYEIMSLFNSGSRILDQGGASGTSLEGVFARLSYAW